MMARVYCPFCNTAFETELPPGQRTTCPRCDESFAIPTQAQEQTQTSAAVDSGDVSPQSSRKPWLIVSILSLLLVGVATALLYFRDAQQPQPIVQNEGVPAATKPPIMLAGVRLMPANTSIIAAIQPSPLLQYAKRTNKEPGALLAEMGLPASLFTTLANLGIPAEQVDHFAIGVSMNAAELPPPIYAVLLLRTELKEDSDLRKAFQATPNPDKPGRFNAELFGLGMTMTKRDGKTYLFASNDKNLDALNDRKPEGIDHLRPGVRETLGELSPASFLWIATDSEEWNKNTLLSVAATVGKQTELLKKLEGIRAIGLSLSIEPDLQLRLAVRTPDETTAKSLSQKLGEATEKDKGESDSHDAWVQLRVPFEPPQNILKQIRKVAEAK